MNCGTRRPNRDYQLVNGKRQGYKNQKKRVWSSEVLQDNEDDQSQDQGSSPSKGMISVIECFWRGGGAERWGPVTRRRGG